MSATSTRNVVDAEREGTDVSIYLESLSDWKAHRSLPVRLSGLLSRRVPSQRRPLRNERPIVTFTFDDIPESALTHGARFVEEAGARATFYVSTALLGRRTEHWTVVDAEGVGELHARGHEIGLHGHAHLPVGARSAAQLAEDIRKNRALLQSIDPGISARNFAYPYGQVSFEKKIRLKDLVRTSRTVEAGLNKGTADMQFIRSVPLCDSALEASDVDAWLDRAVAEKAWLVFYTHDVSDAPSPYGVSKRLLSYALEAAARRKIEIMTLDAALDEANA